MIPKSTISESDRFNTTHPDLCPALRWKAQFILAEPDPTVPASNEGLFWCIHTQTCIGPDGKLAEPGNCSSTGRECHGTGKCGKRGANPLVQNAIPVDNVGMRRDS